MTLRHVVRAVRIAFTAFFAPVPLLGIAAGILSATGTMAVMVPVGLLAGAAPAVLVARAVIRHERRVAEVAEKVMGRAARTEGMAAHIGALGSRGQHVYTLRLRFSPPAFQIPKGLELSRQIVPLPDRKTGDSLFDSRVRVVGAETEAQGALNAEARDAVLTLLDRFGGVRLADRWFEVTLSRRTPPDEVVDAARLMHVAAEALGRDEALVRRLEAIARTDPLAPVRLRAAGILIGNSRGPQARALAEELIAGDDVQAALVAVRALGDVDREAEILARVEGARGQLELTAAEDGALSVAQESAEGALSEPPKRSREPQR